MIKSFAGILTVQVAICLLAASCEKTNRDHCTDESMYCADSFCFVYPGNIKEYLSDVICSSTGDYVGIGTSWTVSNDTYFFKTDCNGNLLNTVVLGKNAQAYDNGYKIIELTDGGFIVYGPTSEFGYEYYNYILKTNGDGSLLWVKPLGKYFLGCLNGFEAINDSLYMVFGQTDLINENDSLTFLMINKKGEILSEKRLSEYFDYQPMYLLKTSANKYVAALKNKNDKTNYLLMQFNADFNHEWVYEITDEDEIEIRKIIENEESALLLFFRKKFLGTHDEHIKIIKLNDLGEEVWTKTETVYYEFVVEIGQDADTIQSNTYLVDVCKSNTPKDCRFVNDNGYILLSARKYVNSDICISKMDDEGTMEWTRNRSISVSGYSDYSYQCNSIAESSAGGYVIGGGAFTSSLSPKGNVLLVKINYNGF